MMEEKIGFHRLPELMESNYNCKDPNAEVSSARPSPEKMRIIMRARLP